MVLKCPVPGCRERWKTGQTQFYSFAKNAWTQKWADSWDDPYTYYHILWEFPTDAFTLMKWMKILDLKQIHLKTARICYKHFEPTAFDDKYSGRRLKKTALPTQNLPGENNSNQETRITLDSRTKLNFCFEKNCEMTFLHRFELIDHLNEEHKIKINKYDLKFNHFEEFVQWKNEEEISNLCQYSKNSRHKNADALEKIYYNCNRSGLVKLMPNNERKVKLKKQGSKKLDYNCTSHIIVRIEKGGKVLASYWKEHYGHDTELENAVPHLSVPTSSKKEIADQLISGLSPITIFRKIEEKRENERNIADRKLSRTDYISLRDIYNIKKQYNVQTVPQKVNDNNNDDSWFCDNTSNNETVKVSEIISENNSSVCDPTTNDRVKVTELISENNIDLYEEVINDNVESTSKEPIVLPNHINYDRKKTLNLLKVEYRQLMRNAKCLEEDDLDEIILQAKSLTEYSENLLDMSMKRKRRRRRRKEKTANRKKAKILEEE